MKSNKLLVFLLVAIVFFAMVAEALPEGEDSEGIHPRGFIEEFEKFWNKIDELFSGDKDSESGKDGGMGGSMPPTTTEAEKPAS